MSVRRILESERDKCSFRTSLRELETFYDGADSESIEFEESMHD